MNVLSTKQNLGIKKMTTKEYLELYKKKNQTLIDKLKIRKFNKSLCKKYPFLIPSNRWTGTRITDKKNCFYGGEDRSIKDNPKYHYEYTELDSMPDGWRIAFGDQMVEEIYQDLKKFDFVDKYTITQIKEKWGVLHWYDDGIPVGKLSEDFEVVERKHSDPYPEDWQKEGIHYKHIETKNYKPVFDNKETMVVNEENIKYNEENAIDVYHKHRIIEKCKVWDIISKYTNLSEHVCINCGKPTEFVTRGWVNYICRDCAERELEAKKNSKYYNIDKNVTVDEFYEKIEDSPEEIEK